MSDNLSFLRPADLPAAEVSLEQRRRALAKSVRELFDAFVAAHAELRSVDEEISRRRAQSPLDQVRDLLDVLAGPPRPGVASSGLVTVRSTPYPAAPVVADAAWVATDAGDVLTLRSASAHGESDDAALRALAEQLRARVRETR